MEERHKRLLIRQNPWWGELKIEVPEFERDLLKELSKYAKYRQVIAVVGLRRVGKTILMKQLIKKILRKMVQNNVCYISFDDIDFQKYELAEDLINYFIEFSDKNKKRYLFLDEIQKLPNWADLLKTYYDIETNLKIFVSGSSSLEVKKSKETLAGRILTFNLPVLTFKEFVRYHGMEYRVHGDLSKEYDQKFLMKKEKYTELFNDYLVRGGFPELLENDNEEFIKKYIKESVIEKVIIDISRIARENERIVYELFRLLANSNAQLFENISLASTLKINRNLVAQYIELLEKSFLIKIAYNFTKSVAKQVRVSKKQYIAHSSIVIALLDYPFEIIKTELVGHLVESTIASHIGKFSFLRIQQNEVDIITEKNKKLLPIEIKYKSQISNKDLRNLIKFMEKFKVKDGVVVTRYLFEKLKLDDKNILFIPAWMFLLSF